VAVVGIGIGYYHCSVQKQEDDDDDDGRLGLANLMDQSMTPKCESSIDSPVLKSRDVGLFTRPSRIRKNYWSAESFVCWFFVSEMCARTVDHA
jgi:hypothetical protein